MERPKNKGEKGIMTTTLQEFLEHKSVKAKRHGFEVSLDSIHPMLFDWQRMIVQWALSIGSAALFQECGTGKTIEQIEWIRHVQMHTRKPVLIVCPLAVAHQTIAEGVKIGVPIRYVKDSGEAFATSDTILITNYDRLKEFTNFAQYLGGVVSDESSILKNYTGKTKRMMMEMFAPVPYKLCCTATPAPNDHLELGNHADYLGVMPSNEMISRWFINDTMRAGGYRLRRNGADAFWRWVTSWAICISKPSDIGYSDEGFELPELRLHEEVVGVDHSRAWEQMDKYGQRKLTLDDKPSATNMWREKKATLKERCERARERFEEYPNEAWALWCDTDAEADCLKELFPQAIEVRGSQKTKVKEERLDAFSRGDAQIIITKPDIAGFGLNWQHCHKTSLTVTYSFEKVYQVLRRFYRFRQTHDVDAHLIFAESEGNIMQVLRQKQADYAVMQHAMNEAMRYNGIAKRKRIELQDYHPELDVTIPQWLRSQN